MSAGAVYVLTYLPIIMSHRCMHCVLFCSLAVLDPRLSHTIIGAEGKGRTPCLPSPFPSLLLSLLPSSSLPCPVLPLSLPLEVGPLNTPMGLGERCKLPHWGLGRSPSRQRIWCILEPKSTALAAAVFVDFPKDKCNFLHKTSMISHGVTICIIDCR